MPTPHSDDAALAEQNVAAVPFSTDHEDFVHDCAFDHYGRRLATCSADESIKVWEADEEGKWVRKAQWRAHSGPVWKLAWAHPEFGQVLASCSFDQNVYIWEEQGSADDAGAAGEGEDGTRTSWKRRAQLGDSRESVNDIKFAPRHLGLRLAAASADGLVRVYEAIDVMNLSHWPLQDEFEADPEGASCLSWNESRFDPPMMVVGGCSSTANVKVWGYHQDLRKWNVIVTLSCGSEGVVHDVAWAPSVGRSYHLIAAAFKTNVLIWKLTQPPEARECAPIASLSDHHAEVWRVQWNVTGSLLASTGDDGKVRMWKQSLRGEWQNVTVVQGEEAAGSATGAASGASAGAAAGGP